MRRHRVISLATPIAAILVNVHGCGAGPARLFFVIARRAVRGRAPVGFDGIVGVSFDPNKRSQHGMSERGSIMLAIDLLADRSAGLCYDMMTMARHISSLVPSPQTT